LADHPKSQRAGSAAPSGAKAMLVHRVRERFRIAGNFQSADLGSMMELDAAECRMGRGGRFQAFRRSDLCGPSRVKPDAPATRPGTDAARMPVMINLSEHHRNRRLE
jgi:hypothetical protein